MASAGPVVAMVWQGKDVVKTGRVMLGGACPVSCLPASAGEEHAKRETDARCSPHPSLPALRFLLDPCRPLRLASPYKPLGPHALLANPPLHSPSPSLPPPPPFPPLATNPLASVPGTIRGDYAIDVGRNVCHGSDSVENALKEIALWFPEGLAQYTIQSEANVYE